MSVLLFVSLLFCIVGYAGLCTALLLPKRPKLNVSLLLLGLIGFSIFMSLQGGSSAWKWLLLFEEPDEWFLLGFPFISLLLGLSVNVKRSIKEPKKTNNRYVEIDRNE